MKWSSEETSASQPMTVKLPAQNHLEFLDLNLKPFQMSLRYFILKEKVKHKRCHATWLHLYDIEVKASRLRAAWRPWVREEKDGLQNGVQHNFVGVMQLFSTVIAVEVTELCTITKIHQSVHFKWTDFTVGNLYFIPKFPNSWTLLKSEFLISSYGECFIH